MNSVKVTMGLLELAVVSKFLSVADTGFSPTGTPQFLDYHLVMATWISVSVVTGCICWASFACLTMLRPRQWGRFAACFP